MRNTVAHSCALSIVYFSVICIDARIDPSSGSASATYWPVESVAAVAASVDSVMGIGQKRPLAVRMPSHTPCQSARDMNPSSGVKPPMPNIIRSPFSRELTRTLARPAARIAFRGQRVVFEQQRQ